MADVPYLILDLELVGLSAEITFNGAVVAEIDANRRIGRSSKLNGWAVSGPNILKVRLGALPERPSDEDRPEPAFELTLRRAMPESPPATHQTLAAYTWQAGVQPLPATGRAQVFETSFAHTPPLVWSWTRGYAFTTLTPADRQGAFDLLQRLVRALTERDIDTVVQLQSVQVGEQAISFGEPPERFLAAYRAFLQERMASPDWRVAPLDPARLRFVGMADGRLQHVTDEAGNPPIVTASGDGRFAIDPYLSKIDGAWTIVR